MQENVFSIRRRLLLVCSKKTKTIVMIFVISNFNVCFEYQHSQPFATFIPASNMVSSTTYDICKRVPIIMELDCAAMFVRLSVTSLYSFIKTSSIYLHCS